MTEPVPEPQINQAAITERSEQILGALLVSVATMPDQVSVALIGQELLDAFTQGFYAGLDAQPLLRPAGPDESDIA